MKWTRTILVSALMLVAAVANAQTVVHEGQPVYRFWQGQTIGGIGPDSLGHIGYIDSNRNLHIVEGSPLSDQNFIFQNIISDCGTCGHAALALGDADSSSILDTHRMRLGTLLLDPGVAWTAVSDTTRQMVFFVQIRTHLSATASDSAGTFPLYFYGQQPLGASGTSPDTVAFGHLQGGNNGVAWSGEITVYYNSGRSGIYNQFGINGRTYYYPGTIAIPLSSVWGRDIYSPYTSIRIRSAGDRSGGGGLQSSHKLTMKAHLIGTPL